MRRFFPIVAGLALLLSRVPSAFAAEADFIPEGAVFCSPCGRPFADGRRHAKECPKANGTVLVYDPQEDSLVLPSTPAPSLPAPIVDNGPEGGSGGNGESIASNGNGVLLATGGDGGSGKGEHKDAWIEDWRFWAAGAAAFLLLLALGLMFRRLRRGSSRPSVADDGRMDVILVPGTLVCSRRDTGDGGSGLGRRARYRAGGRGRWEDACVKRLRPAGASANARWAERRIEGLRFEADLMRALEDTGAVPRVFVPPAEAEVDGVRWNYFAMSFAKGEPWPDEPIGLGGETKRALAALCDAIARLHARQVSHNDLKPMNIFWDPRRDRVTLIDLGSAIDHAGRFSNPFSAEDAGTRPWKAPASDGTRLSDRTLAADAWVYGLLFCQALVGGVYDSNPRAKRRTPERPEDRKWFFEHLQAEAGEALARAVVDGLFALDPARRIPLSRFRETLRKEWRI